MAYSKRSRIEPLEPRRLLSATVSGLIYQDIGAVGMLEPDDPGLAGWTVYLDLNHNGILDAGEPSAVTDASGRYTITDAPAGTYEVREEPITGYKPIPDAYQTVTAADGQTLANVDIGNQKLIDFTYPGLTAAQDDVNNGLPVTSANAPDSSIAINGKYIVTINGNSITTYRRIDGTLLTTQSLAEFFSLAPSILPNAAEATDAQVIYDPGTGKFFIAAIANTPTGSQLLIAGSPQHAPNSALWHYHNIDVQASTGETVFASNLSLSFNGSAIYITSNINNAEGTFVGSRIWLVNRAKAFSLTSDKLIYYTYDPSAEVGLPEVSDINASLFSGKSVSDIGVDYLVADAPASTGGFLDIIAVRHPGNRAKFTLSPIALPADISIASATPGAAAQPDGAPSIDTTFDALDATWRKQYFWIADTLVPSTGPDAGNATVFWFQFGITGFGLLDDGDVSGSSISAGASTFSPSISLDRDNYMALTVAASGPGLDLGSYALSRRSPDPLHTLRPALALNAGSSTYSATTNAAGLVDWSSSQITLDPVTQERFWALGNGADDPASTNGPWSEEIIGFEIPPKIFHVING